MKLVNWHKILWKLALVVTRLLENCLFDDVENDDTLSFLGTGDSTRTMFSFPSV